MDGKIDKTKFTIQFSKTDPSHLQVADILNRQGRRSKAQHLVNAVLHFENCSATPNIHRTSDFDVKVIEAVVYRLLQDKVIGSVQKLEPALPAKSVEVIRRDADEMNFDSALEALGEDGFNAVANTLDMFRNK